MFGFNMARLLPGGTSQRDETFFQTNQMSLMNQPIRRKYGKNFMNVECLRNSSNTINCENFTILTIFAILTIYF